MPRSMLFSRKRHTNPPNDEQPLPLMNQPVSPELTPIQGDEEDDNQSFTEDDEQQVDMECEQPMLTTHHVGLSDPASLVAGQELNKAIWCFMSIFNQQRQQLLQLDQQQNQSNLDSNLNDEDDLHTAHQSEIPLGIDIKQPVVISESNKPTQQRVTSQSRYRQKQQVAQQSTKTKLDHQLYNSSRQLFHLDSNETEEDSNSPYYSSSNSSPKKTPKDHGYLASGSSSKGDDNHHCQDCGKVYSTSSNLARHRQTHRAVTDKKAKKCPDCNKVYVSIPAFAMHIRTHERSCICSYCGKTFSRPWLLKGHIRIHTGEKPFSCKICDKAFADKSNLRAHIQTHSTTKPFVCDRCNKAFALKSYLCKHVDSTCMRANSSQKEPLNLKILNYPKRAKSGIR